MWSWPALPTRWTCEKLCSDWGCGWFCVYTQVISVHSSRRYCRGKTKCCILLTAHCSPSHLVFLMHADWKEGWLWNIILWLKLCSLVSTSPVALPLRTPGWQLCTSHSITFVVDPVSWVKESVMSFTPWMSNPLSSIPHPHELLTSSCHVVLEVIEIFGLRCVKVSCLSCVLS